MLSKEVRVLQNPALGAALIASAAKGFAEATTENAGMPMPLAFLVLPIVLHAATAEYVNRTHRKSGLRFFVEKFGQSANAQSDLVLAIQSRALSFRPTTFKALDLMFQSRIGVLNRRTATILSTPEFLTIRKRADGTRDLLRDAEKLGFWFGELSSFELSSALRVAY